MLSCGLDGFNTMHVCVCVCVCVCACVCVCVCVQASFLLSWQPRDCSGEGLAMATQPCC